MNQIHNEFMKQRKHPFTLIGFVLLSILIAYSFLNTFEQYSSMQEKFDVFVQQQTVMGNTVKPLEPDDPLLQLREVLTTKNAFSWSMMILSTLGPIISCVLGALMIGNEYRFGTVRSLLTNGPSRTRILAAKLTTLALILAAMIVLLMCVGYAIVLGIGLAYDIPLSLPGGALLIEYIVTFLGLFLWALVGFSISLLFRNPLPGVALGIGWPIVEAAILDRYAIRDLLPLWNQKALLGHMFDRMGTTGPALFPLVPEQPSFAQAMLVTLIYIATLILGSHLVFHKQQIS